MMNVDELSNDQIRDRLVELGVNVDPVLDTTRIVYANKLKRLLEERYGSGDAHADTGEPNGETQQFERLETDTVGSFASLERDLRPEQLAVKPVVNHPMSRPVDSSSEGGSLQSVLPEQVPGVVQDLHECERDVSSDESELCGEESSRLLTQEEIRRLKAPMMYAAGLSMASRMRMGARKHAGAGRHLPKHTSIRTQNLCLIITALAVMTVFVFFVIQNLVAVKNGDGNYEEL
ncbi:unnamed protein product [Toxocara canis]|uniref:LEM domain-containing protein n=1 Tax=Toxocara canis TaxID=6265 RepID=A0A183V7E3_TOXCA|nr:unnamed protein product [Toxocara canis]